MGNIQKNKTEILKLKYTVNEMKICDRKFSSKFHQAEESVNAKARASHLKSPIQREQKEKVKKDHGIYGTLSRELIYKSLEWEKEKRERDKSLLKIYWLKVPKSRERCGHPGTSKALTQIQPKEVLTETYCNHTVKHQRQRNLKARREKRLHKRGNLHKAVNGFLTTNLNRSREKKVIHSKY